MASEEYLLDEQQIQVALGPEVRIEPSQRNAAMGAIGSSLGSAAVSSAFRSFAGVVRVQEAELPVAVGSLVLVFDSETRAANTFDQVAQAAHLRTKIGKSSVTVETATGANGLVSYWGYVCLGAIIEVLTLDTLDPQALSMSDFRELVTAAVDHLESHAS